MKIEIRIREVCESRGITTAYQLQKLAGLSPSNASHLYNNNIVQISIVTMEKLCSALKCTPNDLFQVVKPKSKAKG
ncbi:MAG TPA: helix-turn-helix transcriptional regulator [Pyrinomonadaceae bacterium]